MVMLKEFERETVRKCKRAILDPRKEIIGLIHEKQRVRSGELLSAINERRQRIAERRKIQLPNMSPRTLHKHLKRLVVNKSVLRQDVSRKEVYYSPGPEFSDSWVFTHVIEGVARMLCALDRKYGLIESIRLLEKIRDNPDRLRELDDAARLLCKAFDRDLPEPGEEPSYIMMVDK